MQGRGSSPSSMIFSTVFTPTKSKSSPVFTLSFFFFSFSGDVEHVDSSDDDERLGDGARFFVFTFVREARSGFVASSSSIDFTQGTSFFFNKPRIWSSRSLFSSSASSTARTLSRKDVLSRSAGVRRSATSCCFGSDWIDPWRRSMSTSIPPCCSVCSFISPDRLISLKLGPGHFFPVGGKCDIPCLLQNLFLASHRSPIQINWHILVYRVNAISSVKTLLNHVPTTYKLKMS